MFRRKEDELNDAEQGSLLGGSESVKVLSPESNGAYSAPQPASSSAPSYAAAPIPPAPRAPEPAASRAAAPASTFRSSQPAAPEAPRQAARAAEAKPLSSSFSSPVSERHPMVRGETRRVLTVGSDILLKGEIATCDRLVIEGKVDAVLNDVGTVELAEAGSFKGIAQVENAEISGLFEGELICKGRLVIYASGRVCGKITYGEIEIERGGEISGEIRSMATAGTAAAGARKSSLKEDRLKVEAA